MSGSGGGGKSKVVFVGNIPYEMTEEQLVDIFKEVGPVISFRLMFDRETGKARGYGFCEYADPETAASAIRNLNGYDVGGRTLRVDRADQEMQSSTGYASANQLLPPPPPPPLISSTTSPSGLVSIESINATLGSMNNIQLLEVMTQMKAMAMSNPEQTKHLLQNNPALTYAVFQAMIMMNLVDPVLVQQVMAQNSPLPPSLVAEVPPATIKPPPIAQSTPHQPSAEQQRALIMQIMSLTPEQINALPPQQRDQVLQLRAQITQQRM